MKKTFIFIAFAMVSMANAQKGTILVAGNVGINFQKSTQINTESKTNYLEISPKIGYQFTDHWTIGLESRIFSSKNERESVNFNNNSFIETNQNGFIIGAFARYSKPLNETFSVYADLGAGIQNIKTTNTTTNITGNPIGNPTSSTNLKGNGFYIGVNPALFINMKKNFGLNFSIGGLGYETLNYNSNGGDYSGFYFNFGQSVNIGISKNF